MNEIECGSRNTYSLIFENMKVILRANMVQSSRDFCEQQKTKLTVTEMKHVQKRKSFNYFSILKRIDFVYKLSTAEWKAYCHDSLRGVVVEVEDV